MVGVLHDEALSGLPEYLVEADRRHQPGADGLAEDIARADAGQLVGVTYHNNPAAVPQCRNEGLEQLDVHHAHLVEDNDVALEQVLVVVDKADHTAGVVHFQQTVDGGGFPARQFAQTLGGANYTDWEVILKPGRIAKEGAEFLFGDRLGARIIKVCDDGGRIVRFFFDGVFEEILSRAGEMPLPPYIKKKLSDQSRYNTVYSKTEGSAAAPTAGLHFTDALLDRLKNKGVEIVEVLLHVGLGTFRPVKEEDISRHKMHSEFYSVSSETASALNRAKREGRRTVAVGTTSVRVLESASDENGLVSAGSGNTEIFIYPPYKFKATDAMITNFHLPKSTLLMLVSAFAGRENILKVYEAAVREKYRFFSFGDAMFLKK